MSDETCPFLIPCQQQAGQLYTLLHPAGRKSKQVFANVSVKTLYKKKF